MSKPMRNMIIALCIIFGALLIFNIGRYLLIKKFFANYQPPPMTISASKAKIETWQPFIPTVGTLKAVNGVWVTTQLQGIITKINFESGQMVKKGQPLITIDDSVERTDLENNQAALKLNILNFKRQQDLFKQRATPQSQVDEAQAKLTQSQAAVDKVQALIAQKNIVAPFDGKLGIRQINIGQYVSPGAEMVNLQSLNPLYLNFSLPEQYLKNLNVGQTVTLQVDGYPNTSFQAKISAVDSTVTVASHNIDVQATVPNDNMKLYPGLFAVVKVILPIQNSVITVPQTAITSSLFGDSVFVIKEEGKDKEEKPILKVYRQYVTTGDQRGIEIAILKGLKAGEQVVTSGQLKLDDGTRVAINNSVKLTTDQDLSH